MNGKGVLGGAIGAAILASATPAMASPEPAVAPIKIGFIDTSIKRVPVKDGNLKVQFRDMAPGEPASWIGESGYSHGELVAASAVRSARAVSPDAPIEVFAANIYTPETDRSRFGGGRVGRGLADTTKIRLTLNYSAAEKAIDWMQGEGVKVLVVTATGPDNAGMRRLNEHAQKAGMIVVASTNNDFVRGQVFPAAYPDVISVAGDDKSLPIWQDKMLASYVSVVSDGRAPVKSEKPEIGSSFAAGAVGGLVESYASKEAEPTMAGAKAWLKERSSPMEYAGYPIPRVTYADYTRSMTKDQVVARAAYPSPANLAAMSAALSQSR